MMGYPLAWHVWTGFEGVCQLAVAVFQAEKQSRKRLSRTACAW